MTDRANAIITEPAERMALPVATMYAAGNTSPRPLLNMPVITGTGECPGADG